MNPISAFFVRNIIVVFFFYGLAFFVMGIALIFASRQTSEFKFVRAIRPLAAFGILHGVHEWIEMFQKITTLTSGYVPSIFEEVSRLVILLLSFVMLLAFGVLLLSSEKSSWWQKFGAIGGMVVLLAVGLVVVTVAFRSPIGELIGLVDVLMRYSLGIPGALLGTWALMAQQHTFREHDMPQFGRDLVWCAAALFLYGTIGQIFVRQTILVPSNVINSALFLQMFGIPVQLFRGVMAAILAFYMVRALRAFELENQRQMAAANQAKLAAQAAALQAERRVSQEMERLNQALRLTAQELSLLLDLSNLLATPLSLQDRLQSVLEKVVHSLSFSEAGIILLLGKGEIEVAPMEVATGFSGANEATAAKSRYNCAFQLGEQCMSQAIALCRHLDGEVIEFSFESALIQQECQQYKSPMVMIGLPLIVQDRVIGSLVLVRSDLALEPLPFNEFKLMIGVAQQLGLSIENARLYQEAQKREKLLGELLRQVVGAQEAERQRIARELHDATGQSLTALGLGLRGVETVLSKDSPVIEQIKELKSYSTNALDELRRIIADLRPSQLDDLGLVATLQWYLRAFEKRRSIRTTFELKGRSVRLPSEYETVLFRITQEALTNVAKYAEASQVTVKLELSSKQLNLSIKDDGCGFDPNEVLGEDNYAGWGLVGIRERALLLGGYYEIDSKPGRGTCIRVSVPLVEEIIYVKDTATSG